MSYATPLWGQCLHEIFGMLLHGRFIFSSQFIYLLIQGIIYISRNIWIFIYTLDYNPELLYFVSQSVSAFASGSSFFHLANVWLWHTPIIAGSWVGFCFVSSCLIVVLITFLPSGTIRCYRLSLYSLSESYNQPFLQGALVPFRRDWC